MGSTGASGKGGEESYSDSGGRIQEPLAYLARIPLYSEFMIDPSAEKNGHRMPTWAKIFALVALTVLFLLLYLLLSRGGGSHGPQRHFSSDASIVGSGGQGVFLA